MNDQTLTAWHGRFSPQAQSVLRIGVTGTVGLLLLLCLFLAGRRIGGAFDQPLHAASILALGMFVAALASGLRIVWPSSSDSRHWQRWARLGLPTLVVLLFCFALSPPGSSPWAVGLLWFLAVSAEGAWWMREAVPSRAAGRPAVDTVDTTLSTASLPASATLLEAADESNDEITQQLTRIRDDQGQEMVFGQASAEFCQGERSQIVHLAFCPPLAADPQISAMHAGGPDATITVAQAESFGARFEVRLRAAALEAERVMIEFEARCPIQPPPDKGE